MITEKKARKMSYKIFCYYKDEDVFWFRVFGYGLSFSKMKLTFSERSKINKFVKLPFGWRLTFLSKPKIW
jgi:hypothetical protein